MNISENDLCQLIQSVNKRSMFKTQYDIELIHSKLRDFTFFRNMNKEIGDLQYYKILKELQYECPIPYEPLVNIGDQCSKFYFILAGRFLILTNNQMANIHLPTEIQRTIDKLFPNQIPQGYLSIGQYFGEQVMMFDQQHTQTILPLEKSHLLVIKRETYRRIIDQETKKRESERFSNLSTIPLFQKWSAKTVKMLSSEIQELNFIPNQIIYHQGDPVDSVYIIIDGQIQLFRTSNKSQLPLSILGCKESFGDDEILTQFRSHSAKSLTSVKLYRIQKKQFLDLIPFDYSNKYFKKDTPLKLNLNLNEDYSRIYRSESLKAIRSPAQLLQRIIRKSQDKNKTHQSISFQQIHDFTRKDLRYSNTPTVLQKSSSVHEQIRIHANGKFDKTTYLLNQIKLRSTNVWKKTK
ncbi:unnamed protein product (macronuclear) [Paramecium tetraurelia]|uniref:Cyclic nucleotide-binding domain-containing protein n=1 Tax=Paramecium tetraurelia TaxID=5888 RepID=A0DP49_PARTE|nr:uncharacterized protein GSPATT00018997001 [Paramecium tetraurelia]CAK84816.1 unnamed protein product [Paramecium tetraurelia]|eukprot:XP_001452213.1 hypothetical protein (macronuclear) [Paramecium tetraurelia strain d4-2]